MTLTTIATILANSVGDASSSRVMVALTLLLALIGIAMMVLAWWVWRTTRFESDVLGPLEVMGSRAWIEADPETKRKLLADARPARSGKTAPSGTPARAKARNAEDAMLSFDGEAPRRVKPSATRNGQATAAQTAAQNGERGASPRKGSPKPGEATAKRRRTDPSASKSRAGADGTKPAARRKKAKAGARAASAPTASQRASDGPTTAADSTSAKPRRAESHTVGAGSGAKAERRTNPVPAANGRSERPADQPAARRADSDKTTSTGRPSVSESPLDDLKVAATANPYVPTRPASGASSSSADSSSAESSVKVKPVTGEEPALRVRPTSPVAAKKSEVLSGASKSHDHADAAAAKASVKAAQPGKLEPAVSENAGPNSKRALPGGPAAK